MTTVPFHAPSRRLSSWVAAFMEYTDGMRSPEIFRRWAAITAIAGVLERKVWIRSQGANLYPNLYVILCGPPGVGKSNAFHAAETLWRSLVDHHVAPVSITKASLIDTLNTATRIIHHPIEESFNSLLVAVGELGALLPSYDSDFMNALTYLYDGQHYEERRRTKQIDIIIEKPQINLLAGTTPDFLASMLPASAWNQGFLARCIIIFSDELILRPLDLNEDKAPRNSGLLNDLTADMDVIGSIAKKYEFTQGAYDLLDKWHMSGENEPDKPTHPRLQHYTSRRLVHLLKLCMISAVDRGAERIDTYDFSTAMNWMVEAEAFMPDVFKAMASGGDSAVMEDCRHFIYVLNTKNKEPVPYHMIKDFLRQRLPAHSVDRAFKVMQDSGMIIDEAGRARAGKREGDL